MPARERVRRNLHEAFGRWGQAKGLGAATGLLIVAVWVLLLGDFVWAAAFAVLGLWLLRRVLW